MIVIILDKNLREIETFKGYVENGIFHYKEGGLLGLGGTKKTLQLDYSKTISDGKGEKKAYYLFDGDERKQLSFGELQTLNADPNKNILSIQNYIREDQLSQYAEEEMLKKPFSVKDLLEWLAIIALAVIILATYFASSITINHLQQVIQPLNQTLQQNTQLIHILLNQSIQNRELAYKILNSTGSVP